MAGVWCMKTVPIRTLHIISGLTTGGAEKALFNLLNGGLAAHFHCHIVSLRDEGTMGPKLRALGLSVTSIGMGGGSSSSLFALKKLYHIVRTFQPDLIQGWMYHGNLAASLACYFAKGHPALAWNIRHSLYSLRYEKLMMRQIIRINRYFSYTPDVLIYNSQVSRDQHESFGFTSTNGEVIPNGIDVKKFAFSNESRKRIRSVLGIPMDALVLGHVARLHPMKDHSGFLKAAVSLVQNYSHLHLLLSGKDVLLKNYELSQLIPVRLRNRFHLLGDREDVPDLMSAMDVFCLSSAWGEGFPNVIGEAMAAGLTCVATDVGDSALIIGSAGTVVPVQNVDALIKGIGDNLSLTKDERSSLGASGRVRIEDNYTLDVNVNRYVALYTKMIGNSID